MSEKIWKVVPMCTRQKLDIREEDLLNNGDFRKCDTYRGGGGYDRFPYISEKRLGKKYNHQFVVQLYGCSLQCPYCYVTYDGIWGDYKLYSSEDLVKCFVDSNQDIFHLMGGAPAIYLENWSKIIELLPQDKVFHSDILLIEKPYKKEWPQSINSPNSLYAVDIKGADSEDFKKNTATELNENLFWSNLDLIVKSNINFYLTFTNLDQNKFPQFEETLIKRYGKGILEDSFKIDLIEYEAIKKS